MDSTTASALLAINHQFYQTFASQFSATRQRIQPGVQRLLPELAATPRLLDLGCGNGELVRRLKRRGFKGLYVGLDFSPGLLEAARRAGEGQGDAANQPPEAKVILLAGDLSQPGWENLLPRTQFERVVAFAVLHHLPGMALRCQVLQTVRGLLAPGGTLTLSNWQFLSSLRQRGHILPWERVGLVAAQLDPGDYLLDWRSGGYGLRYVHHFTPQELEELAEACGFQVINSFLSDGENGQSGLYQIWKAKQ